MSKPRKTQVPLPGAQPKSRPKTQTKVLPPKSALSQEYVGRDDDSSDEVAARPKPPVQIGIHPPKTNGAAKMTPKPAPKPKATSKPVVAAKPPATKVTPKKIVAEEQGADSTSSSEESEDEGTDIKAAQRRESAKKKSPPVDISSDSDSSSEESEEEAASKATLRTAASPPRQTQPQSHTVAFQAARPYVPPKDFAPVSTARMSSSKDTAIFDNLAGKQVWHITAPADLSLKALKEIAMEQALRGESVVSYKGSHYGFSVAEKEEAGEREVVIPRPDGYKVVSARISQNFNVRQIINLPELSSKQADPNTGSEAAASITRSTIRAPRPQVKGLKMRYFPSGVPDHTPATMGFSDSEDEEPTVRPAGLGVPNDLHLPIRPEKRKLADVNGDDGVQSSSKKHKKHQTSEEADRKAEKKAKKERKKQKSKS